MFAEQILTEELKTALFYSTTTNWEQEQVERDQITKATIKMAVVKVLVKGGNFERSESFA